MISIATRLTDFATGSQSLFQHPDVRFVAVNTCDRDARKQGGLPLVADAREALRALAAAAGEAGVVPDDGYRTEVTRTREAWLAERAKVGEQIEGERMSQGQLILALNEAVEPGDTLVAAAGTPPGDLLKLWDATGGRRCHLEFGYSCMGYEIPGAIGVRMAREGGEVYVYVGDGTFLLNPAGDLVTALQEGLKLTVIVSENHGFQSIRRLQMLRTGRDFGNELRERSGDRLQGDYLRLDLAQVAGGLGAAAYRAASPDELRDSLERARGERRPCVVVCETEPHRFLPGANVWWDVAPAEVSEDPVVQELRAEYEQDRERLQRFYY